MSSSAFLISGIFVMASGISMMANQSTFIILGLYVVGRFGVSIAYDSAFLCKTNSRLLTLHTCYIIKI
jgi:hypothetical protein